MSKERGGSLIFFAVGIYGLVFSIGLPLGRWNEPGPAVFPLALSILLCASGIFWFIQGKGKGEKKESAGLGGFVRKYKTPLRIVGLTAAFIFALEPLGYLLASTLYIFILFFWVSRYRVWIAVVLAVAFGPGSWLFFGKLLATHCRRDSSLLNFLCTKKCRDGGWRNFNGCSEQFVTRVSNRTDLQKHLPLLYRLPVGDRGRGSARHRAPRRDRAPHPGHVRNGCNRRDHHAGRDLLRGHVWRLDDIDPDEHPGRIRLGRHVYRRLPDDPQRTRGGCPFYRRMGFLDRRHIEHCGPHVPSALPWPILR